MRACVCARAQTRNSTNARPHYRTSGRAKNTIFHYSPQTDVSKKWNFFKWNFLQTQTNERASELTDQKRVFLKQIFEMLKKKCTNERTNKQTNKSEGKLKKNL